MSKTTKPPQMLRGPSERLPVLEPGVMAITTDERALYVGCADGKNARFLNESLSSHQQVGGIYAYGYQLKGVDANGMALCDGSGINLNSAQYAELKVMLGGAASFTLPNLVKSNYYPYLRFKRPGA